MPKFDLLYDRVHSSVPFLTKKNKYTISIYCGGGKISEWSNLSKEEQSEKLKKDWYLRWSYRNPETGLMVRQDNIRAGANYYKTKKERFTILNTHRLALKELLEEGFSPYTQEDDAELLTVSNAFNLALSIKKKEIQPTSYNDYKNRLSILERYLIGRGRVFAKDIVKKDIAHFLNKYKAKNSNGFKSAISSIFTVLSDQDIIETNFVKELRSKKERKKAIRIYSEVEINDITDKLKEFDYQLYMYVKLVSYMFWRPIEIVQITNENFDYKNDTLRSNTKGKDGKTKIVPEVIKSELYAFAKAKRGYIFSPHKDGSWSLPDTDRRKYYSRRFARFRKKHNIDSEFKIYNFRHTFITKAYLKLRETMSIADAIIKLSLITGHTSNAIYSYIQVNDVELPEDYSDLLK